MKNLILVIFFLLSQGLLAEMIQNEISFKDFEEAEKTAHLTWIVESTKVGLFSSDVYGYVLSYKYSADLDKENKILRDMTLRFPINAMNSDSESRDEKLHNKCLGVNEYKEVVVKIKGPIFLKDKRKREYQGTVLIRGKEKPFKISFIPSLDEKALTLKAHSSWSLKTMEIPDPSIAVAKLSDEIRLNISLTHPLQ
jgi:hypothetical protein